MVLPNLDEVFEILEENPFDKYTKQEITPMKVSNGTIMVVLSNTNPKRYFCKKIPKLNYSQPNPNLFDVYNQHMFVHPNIIRCKEIYSFNDFYYLIEEYPLGDPLLSFVDPKAPMEHARTVEIVIQLLSVVNYLGCLDTIHRNLNPDIIYVDSYNLKVTIIDMGSCTFKSKINPRINSSIIFSAPEYLDNNKEYDAKVDIWSVGIICYLLLYNEIPYKDMNERMAPREMKEWVINKGVKLLQSAEKFDYEQFLGSMLNSNPKNRMDIDSAIAHQYLTSNYNTDFVEHLTEDIMNIMTKVCKDNILPKAVLYKLSCVNKNKITSFFTSIDNNKNGTIDLGELEEIYQHIVAENTAKQFAKNIMDLFLFQKSKDNIDYHEFGILISSYTCNIKRIENLFLKIPIEDGYFNYVDLLDYLDLDNYWTVRFNHYIQYLSYYDKDSNLVDFNEFLKHLFCDSKIKFTREYWYRSIMNSLEEKTVLKPEGVSNEEYKNWMLRNVKDNLKVNIEKRLNNEDDIGFYNRNLSKMNEKKLQEDIEGMSKRMFTNMYDDINVEDYHSEKSDKNSEKSI